MCDSNDPLLDSQKLNSFYPSCIPVESYGTSSFWVEEIKAITKVEELEQKYPNINFSGLIDPIFKGKFDSEVKDKKQKQVSNVSKPSWEINRQFLNIATSHAPSRIIAQNYLEKFDENFGIISLDAHLDLTNSESIRGTWLSEVLAHQATVIGGWAENSYDLENAKSSLAFVFQDHKSILKDNEFQEWLRGKKIYITLDLDYFNISNRGFLGYSNFWHRDKIIGHSLNFEQMLELRFNEFSKKNTAIRPILLGKFLGYFSDLKNFSQDKKRSIKLQSEEIKGLLHVIAHLCRKKSVSIISLDFVEYSPICDWQQFTIRELIKNYFSFLNILGRYEINSSK